MPEENAAVNVGLGGVSGGGSRNHKPPPELCLSGNVSNNWKKWRQKFEIYLKASKTFLEPEDVQVATLLSFIGDQGLEAFNNFKFNLESDKNKLKVVIDKFEKYCTPLHNVAFDRFRFFQIMQKEGQTFEQFLTEAKTAAGKCEFNMESAFESREDSLVRDRVIFGIRDEHLQERLLAEPNLTLVKAADLCRAAEDGHLMVKEVRGKQTISVDAVVNKPFISESYLCKKCAYTHKAGVCPAFGKNCAVCGKKNHFARGCPKRQKQEEGRRQKKVHELRKGEEEDEESDESSDDPHNQEDLYVCIVKKQSKGCRVVNAVESWTEDIIINNCPVNFKLDSGAEASILPLKIVNQIIGPGAMLKKTNAVLVAFGDADFKVKPKGTVTLRCRTQKGIGAVLEFVVVDVDTQPLLGLSACIKLDLLKRIDKIELDFSKENVVKSYSDVFEGLGNVPGEHCIEIKENAVPVVHASRRVPLSLHDRLKETLDSLEKRKVVEKVNKPTEWVNSLVIIEKADGSLRLCLDPKDLNKVIKREHHLIPKTEDLIAKLSGNSVFSVLDMKDGFWQCKISDDSADLCTFSTPFGRYRFLRLPFGICSAPEVFQKTNERLFGNIKNVQVYFDDIIIAGKTIEEHDLALAAVLDQARNVGVRFNESKFQFRVAEVKFVGRRISKKGVAADSKHIRPIVEMDTPCNKKDVMRFLGMAKHLAQFIPNLSQISAPLRQLTRQDVLWEWASEHEKAFNNIKAQLTKAPVLGMFRDSVPLTLQTDASKDGLGACLIQDGHPIAYASRSLTQCEQHYAQIEKELLAIVYGLERFHQFTYGREVTIHSDHKPLESITMKNMDQVSARLQRMLLRLLKYQITIRYVPGKLMYLADTLSRAYLKDPVAEDPELQYIIHSVVKYLPMTDERKEEFRKATQNDESLITLTQLTRNGWPEFKKDVPENLQYYWNLKDDIQVAEGLVFVSDRLIVPTMLRPHMLSLLHEGHLGMERCKARARQTVCWPGMSKDIEATVAKCNTCEKFRTSNQKETMIPHQVPDRPWAKVAADILEIGMGSFLVVTDYYTKWLELVQLRSKTASEVIQRLKSMFARLGIPDEFMADNMPFNSMEFRRFAKDWDFKLQTSSPNYPQSNGMAEKAVSIAKMMIKKSKQDGTDVYLALMEYRSTPIKGLGLSPAQLLLGHQIKTKIPTCGKFLEHKCTLKPVNVKAMLQEKQEKQKMYYDRNAKDLKELNEGASILVKKKKVWEPAQVIKKYNTPRSYIIRDANNQILRRNRVQLTESVNPPPVSNHRQRMTRYLDTCNQPIASAEQRSPVRAVTPEATYEELVERPSSVKSPVKSTRSGRMINKPLRFRESDE